MLLRLLVIFYFAFDATFLGNHPPASGGSLVGCVSVPQYIQYHEDVFCTTTIDEELIRRQSTSNQSVGITMFPSAFYVGVGDSIPSVTNGSISVQGSFQIDNNTWAAATSPSVNTSIIFWSSVPDTSALSLPSGLVITNIQSSSCSPPCAGAGICDPTSQKPECTCPEGFNGTLCESCTEGHFGPKCQPCPSKCTASCDQGISGSGLCSPVAPKNAICNNGQCKCPPGQGISSDGTACVQCQQGFYSTPAGGCQVCQEGCSVCDSVTGDCINCQNGFQPATDKTKCDPKPNQLGNKTCPASSFSNSNTNSCTPCEEGCKSCNSDGCLVCGFPQAMLNTTCVGTDSNGICGGSNGSLIADNNKNKCETCAAVNPNCATCKIPNFNVASTIDNAQCTGCSGGFLLSSNGSCTNTCPSGTFSSGGTCKACSSECKTCAGTADQCTACADGFVSSGKCVTTCPHGTFSSNGNCAPCHPDCGTCKGSSINDCLSCSQNLPAFNSSTGRCLATCNQNSDQQPSLFFNTNTSTCQNCDSSCSSCFGPELNQCLACTDATYIVVNGICSPTAQLVPPAKVFARWT